MYQANQSKAQRSIKRLVLAVMLVLACLVLSGCYTDPDRAFDGDPNLNLNPSSTFETVVTNTPVVTNSPTPSPAPVATETPLPEATQGSVDWNDFQWGNTNQPDQPTNVVTSAPNSSGIINNGGSSVITQNIAPSAPPQNVQTNPGQTNTGSNGGYNSGSNSGSTPIVNGGSNSGSTPIVNGGSNSGSTPIVNNGGSSSSNSGGSSSNSGGSSSSNNGGSSSSNGGSSSSNNGGSSSSNSGGSSSSSSVLKIGSKGEEVKRLQDRLKVLKYYSGSSDGDYGQGTANAVKEFQKNNNLDADGVAGKKTLEAVYSYYAVPKTSTGSGNGGGGSSSKPSSGSSSSSSSKPSSGSSSSGSSSKPSSGSSSSSNANSYTNGETNTYLKLGSTGAQVKIMQNRLIVLGYLSGTANGKFETTTEAAVMAFQKRHNMYADGIAGPDTLTKLYSSSAKKADSVVANLGSLKEGSQGGAVRALQRNLRTLGYYTGSVDGDYGPGTVAAVTAFQNANGLTADGIAGNGTQGAIIVAINGGSTGGGAGSGSGSGSGNNGSTNPVTYGSTATSNGYSTISGSNGNTANITAVQSALRAKGYYSGSLDGKFGGGTQKAVEDFQRSQGLRVTGMAGPTTQRLLYGGTAADGSYKKLELGSSGSNVKALQYALYEMKYYDGNITGNYDDATESAVMLFQDCNGLEIDGIAGQKTQQLLFSSAAKPCTK